MDRFRLEGKPPPGLTGRPCRKLEKEMESALHSGRDL